MNAGKHGYAGCFENLYLNFMQSRSDPSGGGTPRLGRG